MLKLRKYLPDIFILVGIWIFTYVYYFPVRIGGLPKLPKLIGGHDYSNNFKFAGIILVTIGINIAIRKIIARKTK